MSGDECGVVVEVRLSMAISFGKSVYSGHVTLDPTPFTEEEVIAGRAIRYVALTRDQAWRNSTCIDCDLPLPLHPNGRKRRSRKRYCDAAKKQHESWSDAS